MSRLEGSVHVNGTLSAKTLAIPSGTLVDAGVAENADIGAQKLEHQFPVTYAQESETTAAAETRVVHAVYGATGEIISVEAGAITPCVGDATVDIDVKVNGSSVLSATIELSSSQSARELVAGTISSADLSDGDVIEVDIAVTAGTGTLAEGVFVTVILREKAA